MGSLEGNFDRDSFLMTLSNQDADLEDMRVSCFQADIPHLNTTSAAHLGICEAASSAKTLLRTCQGKN